MNIKEKIEEWVKETLNIQNVALVHPKEMVNGDFSLIINGEGAEEFAKKLEGRIIPEISKVVFVAPRFINFYLSKKFFETQISEVDESFGKTDLLKGEKIFIEHTQPNPFKKFHIGHVMNNVIGESVSRILRANNADVKVASYHGDVGIHIAKALWGLLQNIDSFGDAYARGNTAYEENENAKKEIIEINKKIYNKSDSKLNELYEEGRLNSLEYFKYLYNKLDSHFDFHFFESESGVVGEKIVKENIGKVFEESDGAIVFRGENFEPKTHTRVFLNSEGLPTYEAKEVGLAEIKKEKFKYDKSITVTANEQDAFFSVVEVAIGEIFQELKGKLKHLSHGMLKLATGKMSSRTGNVITAESLIDQVKEKVSEKIQDRGFNDEEKNEIAEVVAIGAIKYSILRQSIGGDIIFDFEKSLSFEGDSGPYLQYTYVRTRSVLEKANYTTLESSKKPRGTLDTTRPESFEITEIEKMLYRFPEVVERAGREYAPHHLVTYLTELAGAFNSFYAKEKIVDESDPTSPYKLTITSAVAHTLKNGLHLLGIKAPERM